MKKDNSSRRSTRCYISSNSWHHHPAHFSLSPNNKHILETIISFFIQNEVAPQEELAIAQEVIQLTNEDLIRITFPEQPDLMVRIADCESDIEQFRDDGTVKISPTSDVGVMQINQVHFKEATRLGIDIYTVEGNLKFARLLYDRRGVKDWYMSEHCWNR